MKAQEYFDKYFSQADTLPSGELFERSKAMLKDMGDEFAQLGRARNAKTFSAVVSIVNELNTKWNSVASKVEKKCGEPKLKRNVFYNLILHDKFPNKFSRKPD